ncbi:MAG: ABC transporter ATP-binding protein [Hyphomicrobiaceae bacterium]
MSDVVIRAEGVGKRYLIGHQSAERERYTALRDVIGRSLKGLGRSALDMIRGHQIVAGDEVEEFWALKDVSFEIKRGEVVGIIGRNGAGKSTLLKVLSRITEPTTGRVEIKGRVASLLEVGTGFHPELTGRENIYLNGAILGMTRAEIRKKFDEIVAFAEIEKFLDTPVKRYSSGMYVRLAFAVAAHLEPEVLIVDEVLAVGDAEFQKKCLGKMQDVAGHGRTVLFVSHNMGAVADLCASTIHLLAGSVDAHGATQEILATYRKAGALSRHQQARAKNISVAVECSIDMRVMTLSIELKVCQDATLTDLCPIIRDARDNRIAIFDARDLLSLPKTLQTGSHRIALQCSEINLVAGEYTIDIFLGSDSQVGDITDTALLTIPLKHRSSRQYQAEYQGVLDLPFRVQEERLA